MANLYIAEYAGVGVHSGSVGIQAPYEPVTASQKVSFTTAISSSAFNANTVLVRLLADADCHIDFSGTATATDPLYKSNIEYFRCVVPGDTLSVYDGSS